jgi:hypothetical protein
MLSPSTNGREIQENAKDLKAILSVEICILAAATMQGRGKISDASDNVVKNVTVSARS